MLLRTKECAILAADSYYGSQYKHRDTTKFSKAGNVWLVECGAPTLYEDFKIALLERLGKVKKPKVLKTRVKRLVQEYGPRDASFLFGLEGSNSGLTYNSPDSLEEQTVGTLIGLGELRYTEVFDCIGACDLAEAWLHQFYAANDWRHIKPSLDQGLEATLEAFCVSSEFYSCVRPPVDIVMTTEPAKVRTLQQTDREWLRTIKRVRKKFRAPKKTGISARLDRFKKRKFGLYAMSL